MGVQVRLFLWVYLHFREQHPPRNEWLEYVYFIETIPFLSMSFSLFKRMSGIHKSALPRVLPVRFDFASIHVAFH